MKSDQQDVIVVLGLIQHHLIFVGEVHVKHPSYLFFFSSRRRHTRFSRDWSSDVCSSDLREAIFPAAKALESLKAQRIAFKDARAFLSITAESNPHASREFGACENPRAANRHRARNGPVCDRSEERRVGKECKSWWR